MKKLAILGLAALLIVAIAMPVMALESQFGGYWRARAYTQQNFLGQDEEDNNIAVAPTNFRRDTSQVDSRTRLYYTAILNDDLRLVNKFEFNTNWGQQANAAGAKTDGYGAFGADATASFRIKNTYVDFNLGPVNAKIGTQGAVLARGFLWNDDFSGAILTYKGDSFSIPVIWMKAYEGGAGFNARDVDYFGIAPTFNIAKIISLNPYALWATSDNIGNAGTPVVGTTWGPAINPFAAASLGGAANIPALDDTDLYYIGFDADAKFGVSNAWLTAIYQGGNADIAGTPNDISFKAWLAAIGGKYDFGIADVHGQAFYATGDEKNPNVAGGTTPIKANERNTFFVPAANNTGTTYYWAEILGMGMFDNQTLGTAAGTGIGCGYHVTNVLAANLGATFKPPAVPDLSVTLDVWYAQLAEDRLSGGPGAVATWENDLGTEIDLKLTYQLIQGLQLDVVGAYLFAGDALYRGNNDANPYEIG